MSTNKGRRALQTTCIVFAGFSSKDTNRATSWIRNLAGSTSNSVYDRTTHVIVNEKAWRDDHPIIQKARAENEERSGDKQIKFVTWTWVEDCANNKAKKSEGPYLCERVYAKDGETPNKRGKKADGVGPRSHKGLMKEMLAEQTEKHMDERSRRELRVEMERAKRTKKMEEKEKEEALRKDQAEVFKRGAKKARNEIFTENHHIYTDATGFKYDVPITKVDVRRNRNQRYCITIYESNTSPHTYATNLHFSGTLEAPENKLLVAVGTNFPTALRSFKEAFKAHTKVEWDDRVSYAFKRAEERASARGRAVPGLGTGSVAGTPVGTPVEATRDGNAATGAGRKEVRFEDMVFEYFPPRFGAKGVMPQDKMDEVAWLGEKKKKEGEGLKGGDETVEAWMSAANGDGYELPEIEEMVGEKEKSSQAANLDGGISQEELEDLLEDSYPFEGETQIAEHAWQDFNGIMEGTLQEMTQTEEAPKEKLDFSFDEEGQVAEGALHDFGGIVEGSGQEATQDDEVPKRKIDLGSSMLGKKRRVHDEDGTEGLPLDAD